MSESTPHISTGWRAFLNSPTAYNTIEALLGAGRAHTILAQRYIRAQPGDKILDLGCGPADILNYLPTVDYTGCDINADYLVKAGQRKPDGRFILCEVPAVVSGAKGEKEVEAGSFDLVLALAVLHHLNDTQAKALMQTAAAALKPGGRFIAFDCVFTRGQNPLARLLIHMDRGQNARYAQGYVDLAREAFDNPQIDVATDMLPVYIPYTHSVLQATR